MRKVIQGGECDRGHGQRRQTARRAELLMAPPLRIPPCARAPRPDKEHVSMTEETARTANRRTAKSNKESVIG
jgi:hypothetical protein